MLLVRTLVARNDAVLKCEQSAVVGLLEKSTVWCVVWITN